MMAIKGLIVNHTTADRVDRQIDDADRIDIAIRAAAAPGIGDEADLTVGGDRDVFRLEREGHGPDVRQ